VTTTTTTSEKKDKMTTLQVWEGAILISRIVLKTHETIIHDPTGLRHILKLKELSKQAKSALAPNSDMVLSAVSCVSPAILRIVWPCKKKVTNGRLILLHAQKVASFGPSIACSTFALMSKTITFPFDIEILSIDLQKIEGMTTEPIQATLLLPKNVPPQGEKVPLVVVPHGGPHSCTMSTFVPGFDHLA
jgi:hypothetical protein